MPLPESAEGSTAPDDYTPEIIKAFEINSTRSSVFPEQEIAVPEAGLIELQFEDDTAWLSTPEDLPELFDTKKRSAKEGEMLVEIPVHIDIPAGERGLAKRIFLKFLKILSPPASKEAAKVIAQKIEAKILEEGLYLLNPDFRLKAYNIAAGKEALDTE